VVRKILNAKGATFVEILVAAGLTGAVSLGVMKLTETSQKQNIYSKQNQIIDDYVRGLRSFVSDKAQCDQVFLPSGGAATVSLGAYKLIGEGMDIKNTKILLPRRTSGREVLPLSLFVYFDRNLAENYGSELASPVRKITANVIFQDGNFVECSDYESEAERSAFKIGCETLGGEVVIDGADNQSCDFSKIPANHVFLESTKEKVCSEVYQGVYLGGKCNSMNMNNTNFYGQNIQDNFFNINGVSISSFRQDCAGDNNFMVGINSDGTVVCKEIKRCTKGDAQCP